MQRVVQRNISHQMPTVAKLFGAAGMAITGLCLGNLVLPVLPLMLRGAEVLPVVAASFGLLIGWRVMTPMKSYGFVQSIGAGLRAAVYVCFWTLTYLGAAQMLRLSMNQRYDGAFEALLDIFTQGLYFSVVLAQPRVLATLLVGGALSGMVARWGARRWP